MTEDTPEIEHRLTVLEERTREKPKSFLTHIQDWAGLVSLLVALLYTFPLGLWDRFFVTPEQQAQKQRAQDLLNLRNLVQKLSQLDADYGRTSASIADPSAKTFFTNAIQSQKSALVAGNLELITKEYNQLTPSEMELLGYQIGAMGNTQLALQIFTTGASVASSNNPLLGADIYRMQARVYFPGSSLGPQIANARTSYINAIRLIIPIVPPQSSEFEAIQIVSDWSQAEIAFGDPNCSLVLSMWNLTAMQSLNPSLNVPPPKSTNPLTLPGSDSQNSIANSPDSLASALGTSGSGSQNSNTGTDVAQQPEGLPAAFTCPTSILPWRTIGWPWQPVGNQ